MIDIPLTCTEMMIEKNLLYAALQEASKCGLLSARDLCKHVGPNR